tara:strand:+ start:2602 stop:3024 length:423 start_codon:yes stop_codon:yes gene_type:complete
MSIIEIAGLKVNEASLRYKFTRASGPGGQHVNKVSSAVELRFDLDASDLPYGVKSRLEKLVGNKLTATREIVFFAQTHRSQIRNREEALNRLVALLKSAQQVRTRRVPTRPSHTAKRKRLENKKRRGEQKRVRKPPKNYD